MTTPGGDAADRALDDALALANESRRGAGRAGADEHGEPAGPPPNDPLAVALGHEPAAARPRSAARPATALPPRPAPGTEPPPAAAPVHRSAAGRRDVADPLAVLFGSARDDRSPGGQGTQADRARRAAADPVDVAMSLNDEVHAARQDPRRSDATPPSAPSAGAATATSARPRPGTPPPTTAAAPPGSRTAPPASAPAAPPARRASRGAHEHAATPWPDARRIARQAGRRLAPQAVPLGEQVLGRSLARGLVALTDLPSFDSSAMDGWAVAGPGPWLVKGQVLAGQRHRGALHGGHAVRVATGTALPAGTTAVLRSEHGRTEERTDGTWLQPQAPHLAPAPGQEIRHRGQECRGGDELLPVGTTVTPTVLGLAAAAGYDELVVTARPRVELLVLGDELLDHGLPRSGQVRDALGPMLPSWLRALGADVTSVRRLVDDADVLREAVAASGADLVVTTGGTAGGPVDHVHPVLAALGARLLVDGVAVRPGHPMLLAALPGGGAGAGHGDRHLIGLPGNPLAAVSGMLTLVAPLLRVLGGRPAPAPYAAPLTDDVHGHPRDTRLVPVVFDDESAARPLHFAGPAMLRGIAAADGMAVIPPGGARAGEETAVLDTGALGPSWGSGG